MLDASAETACDCPQCGRPMAPCRLHAHTGRPVLVDHCARCRLIWFDTLESVQLSGLGWVELLRELERDEAHGPGTARPDTLPCPRCRKPLKSVHNRSRWGRFPMLECPERHGHLHSDAGLLAELGVVRPLLPPERAIVLEHKHALHCLNCGAPAEFDDALGRSPGSDECRWCGSPLLVFDLPRLAHALSERGAASRDNPRADGTPLRWPCRACGAPLNPSLTSACPQCRAGVVAPTMADLQPLLNAVEPGLRAAANHPPPRPKRSATAERTWRDTTIARLLHWLRRE